MIRAGRLYVGELNTAVTSIIPSALQSLYSTGLGMLDQPLTRCIGIHRRVDHLHAAGSYTEPIDRIALEFGMIATGMRVGHPSHSV